MTQHTELARAIGCLDPAEEKTLCAFVERCERARQQGEAILAWRICRDPQGWICECYTVMGQRLIGEGETCALACERLALQLAKVALSGASA